MNDKVLAYLKQDRQWPRYLRLAHAQYQLRVAKTDADRAFWREVRKANSHLWKVEAQNDKVPS